MNTAAAPSSNAQPPHPPVSIFLPFLPCRCCPPRPARPQLSHGRCCRAPPTAPPPLAALAAVLATAGATWCSPVSRPSASGAAAANISSNEKKLRVGGGGRGSRGRCLRVQAHSTAAHGVAPGWRLAGTDRTHALPRMQPRPSRRSPTQPARHTHCDFSPHHCDTPTCACWHPALSARTVASSNRPPALVAIPPTPPTCACRRPAQSVRGRAPLCAPAPARGAAARPAWRAPAVSCPGPPAVCYV